MKLTQREQEILHMVDEVLRSQFPQQADAVLYFRFLRHVGAFFFAYFFNGALKKFFTNLV